MTKKIAHKTLYPRWKGNHSPCKKVPLWTATCHTNLLGLGLLILLNFWLAIGCATSPRESPQEITDNIKAPTKLATQSLVLISIDGMRWDYIKQFKPHYLSQLAQEGVQASSLIPVFPSKTFPNHYSIVTGLYAGRHGIVSNRFYDPDFDATYSLGDHEAVIDGRWYLGEPIWVTAEKQGQRAFCYFWPGSEARIQGIRPHRFEQFDDSIPGPERVQTVLGWLNLKPEQRPHFVSLYFSDVDHAGHSFGPLAQQTQAALHRVDGYIGQLLAGITSLHLEDRVTIMVVSDHGMTDLSQARPVSTSRLFEPDAMERTVISETVLNLWPKKDAPLSPALLAERNPRNLAYQVYSPQSLPRRYELMDSTRLSPLIVVANPGYYFIESEEDISQGGTHGYDPHFRDMQGIFIAKGPSLAQGRQLPSFENVDIYQMMTHILGLKPAPHQGHPRTLPLILR